MAVERPVDSNNEALSATAALRPPRRPIYKDPLSIIGWGIALASVVAYWYFFVRRPVPKPGQQVAQLTAVEGRVRVKPNEQEAWAEARLADKLHVGDVVQTEIRAGAQISFNSGSVVSMRPDSVVYIGGSAEASTAAWRVQSGRVNFSTGDETTEIVSPTVRTTAMQNAAGNINVTDAGATDVMIFRGRAELETVQGQRISLNANQAVQVDSAGKAGPTKDLPPPPTLIAPAPRARLSLVAPPGVSAKLSWSPVENGVTYRVAMDYNVTQANLLLSAALDQSGLTATTHDIEGLQVGRYFWRVCAVNRDGLEGDFSRVSFFSVVEPEAPQTKPPVGGAAPTLVLQTLDQVAPGIVYIGGRTDRGATVTVDGTAVKVLADGSFGEYVRYGGAGELVVRATGRDGQLTEQSRAVSRR
jgi:hypothetical protein